MEVGHRWRGKKSEEEEGSLGKSVTVGRETRVEGAGEESGNRVC